MKLKKTSLIQRLKADRAEIQEAIRLSSLRCSEPSDDGSDDCGKIDDCLYHTLLELSDPIGRSVA